MIDWVNAAWAGAVGASVMLVMIALGRAMGLIQADMARYQGCILTGRADGPGPVLAGTAMHLTVGAVLAIGYAVVFAVWGEASWPRGAAIGLVHWLVAGFGLPVMDAMNPCVRDGRTRGFGLFGKDQGVMMVLGFMAGHLVYGALVGWLYR